jgi:hypothetical protein
MPAWDQDNTDFADSLCRSLAVGERRSWPMSDRQLRVGFEKLKECASHGSDWKLTDAH